LAPSSTIRRSLREATPAEIRLAVKSAIREMIAFIEDGAKFIN
jgi:hypothetical protein